MTCIRFLTLLFAVICGQTAFAQSAVLQSYIQEGIANSDALRQQDYQRQKNIHALEEAKGLFWPSLNLNGTYTLAGGGRAISFPIGDLMNPVYSTLNDLTGTNQFPQLDNFEENFNPHNFYDVKLQLGYPIVNPDIRYNKQIKKQSIELSEVDIEISKQELKRNIRVAYFQYLQAQEAVDIYESALTLLRESRRVNQKLYENNMINRTAVTRAESEITKVQAQMTQAQNDAQNAAAYFNFLLNKPLDTPIAIDEMLTNIDYNFPETIEGNTENREELRKMVVAQGINQTNLKLNQAYQIPDVSAFIDAGSQGFDFEVGNGSFYVIGGVAIDLPIFNGNRNKQKIKMAEMDVAAVQAQRDQVADQLALQLSTSKRNYQSALQQFASARAQVRSAQQYFEDVARQYREGQVLYIEYLDARNELTNAQLQQSINLYDVWIKWAEVQRAIGR
jgi:outer membrane protein TolC